MDFRLMQQMTHGNTKFTGNPKLTVFPIGNNSTPGLIANSLFHIYTPSHAGKSSNIELKEVKKVDKEEVSEQTGSGQPQIKATDGLKRKFENDVYEKMMHPTFKVSKLKPNKNPGEKVIISKTGNGSLKQTKQEKKFHKF